jgi:hypothetical protein
MNTDYKRRGMEISVIRVICGLLFYIPPCTPWWFFFKLISEKLGGRSEEWKTGFRETALADVHMDYCLERSAFLEIVCGKPGTGAEELKKERYNACRAAKSKEDGMKAAVTVGKLRRKPGMR